VSPTDSVRLFVALELPAPVRSDLWAWAREHAGSAERLRLVDPDSLHVTLCFLGNRPATEVDEIATTCRTAVSRLAAPHLEVAAAVWLPPRRPRVLTVKLTDEAGRLATIQSALAHALAAGGFYTPETRPFLAHVTVARVRRDAHSPRIEPPAPKEPRFTSNRVTLFQSRLGHGPAQYEPLSSIDLKHA